MPAFQPGLPAARVDRALRQALADLDQARQSALLWFHEVRSRTLYQDLGYASMELYAAEALGFSANRTSQFMKLARDLERLPPLKQAVVAGRLEWTKAQQVARVASPRTAQQWVDVARDSSRRDLARKVQAARLAQSHRRRAHQGALALEAMPAMDGAGALPASPPPAPRVSVTLSFDSLDAARLEAMLEAAKKAGLVPATATREEAILAAMGALLEGRDHGRDGNGGDGRGGNGGDGGDGAGGGEHKGSGAAVLRRHNAATNYKVVLYRCDACQSTEVVTGSGRRRVDPGAAAAALENSEVSDRGGGRSRSAIAPGLRRQVLMRDGHCCQAPGCRSARFLEVHHRLPRAHGGGNRLENLITLCSRCHRFAHRRPQAAGAACGGERSSGKEMPRPPGSELRPPG